MWPSRMRRDLGGAPCVRGGVPQVPSGCNHPGPRPTCCHGRATTHTVGDGGKVPGNARCTPGAFQPLNRKQAADAHSPHLQQHRYPQILLNLPNPKPKRDNRATAWHRLIGFIRPTRAMPCGTRPFVTVRGTRDDNGGTCLLVSMADLPGSGRTPVKGTGERKYVVVVQIYALPLHYPTTNGLASLASSRSCFVRPSCAVPRLRTRHADTERVGARPSSVWQCVIDCASLDRATSHPPVLAYEQM
jgi:hypothetical protein